MYKRSDAHCGQCENRKKIHPWLRTVLGEFHSQRNSKLTLKKKKSISSSPSFHPCLKQALYLILHVFHKSLFVSQVVLLSLIIQPPPIPVQRLPLKHEGKRVAFVIPHDNNSLSHGTKPKRLRMPYHTLMSNPVSIFFIPLGYHLSRESCQP